MHKQISERLAGLEAERVLDRCRLAAIWVEARIAEWPGPECASLIAGCRSVTGFEHFGERERDAARSKVGAWLRDLTLGRSVRMVFGRAAKSVAWHSDAQPGEARFPARVHDHKPGDHHLQRVENAQHEPGRASGPGACDHVRAPTLPNCTARTEPGSTTGKSMNSSALICTACMSRRCANFLSAFCHPPSDRKETRAGAAQPTFDFLPEFLYD